MPDNWQDEPAFPRDHRHIGHNGMYMLDWFAGQIASGMAAHSGTAGAAFGPSDIAKRSYEIAQALVAERQRLALPSRPTDPKEPVG